MYWWIDIAILLGSFVFLIAIQQLRAVLALAFPKMHARRLPADTRIPESLAPLFAQAQQELAELGFCAPQWALASPDRDIAQPGIFAHLIAVFCHPGQNSVAVLAPPMNPAAPNTLNTLFVTRLADGRELSSQVRDMTTEALADQRYPAQTIDGKTLAAQWRQHLQWRARFPAEADADYGRPEKTDDILSNLRDDYHRLLQDGRLWRDAQGAARPTLRFALRIMKLYWTRPRPQADKQPVPLSRLAMFASFRDHWQQRLLPTRWQWLLFAVSCLLFAALGALFWDPLFALILFGVIMLHEGGHYLAMRAFGYRHVQMLALPLLGGVTIGVEQRPSASRRAWMSLMGPLPGIVLGWGLLFAALVLFPGQMPGWLSMLAITLLLVNYLNLLPIPPLDGGHIVQAMLPPRWHGVQAAFVAVACLGGAALAWASEFYILMILALLQLVAVPARLSNGRAALALADSAEFAQASRPARVRLALAALQQKAGDALQAAPRIEQAENAVRMLEQTPMSIGMRLLLALMYLLLLSVPVVYWLMYVTNSY